jgi:PleD family two-component response regulator
VTPIFTWTGEIMSGTKGSRETILVVDDNELILEAVVKILESANFKVLSASNATIALNLAKGLPRRLTCFCQMLKCRKCQDRIWARC